jgi:hypothetical protein
MVNKYSGKVGGIESLIDNTLTGVDLDNSIIDALTKSYVLDFPTNKSPKVYDEMQPNDISKIKTKIKESINLFKSL